MRVVGVVPKGANHIFWQTVHAGAIKAAREFHFEVEWNAPTLEVDSSRQIEIVESMINRHVAGIVLAPVDRQALVGVVERAAREGIPVSIFDSAIDTNRIVSYVATDNTEGGRMAARRLGEVLGGKGKVGVIGFMPGSASTMEREDGFQNEIRKRFPGIEIVGMQFGMADRAKAMAETENILTAHPDLAGLFADNESSSSGAVQALKSRRLDEREAGGVRRLRSAHRRLARWCHRFAGGAESISHGLRKHARHRPETGGPDAACENRFRRDTGEEGRSGQAGDQSATASGYSAVSGVRRSRPFHDTRSSYVAEFARRELTPTHLLNGRLGRKRIVIVRNRSLKSWRNA